MFSQETSKTSPWTNIDIHAIPWVARWCSDFQYILCSQSNLAQLSNTGCNLVCIALIAPERGMTQNALINQQARGTLSRYLDPDELTRINDPNTSPYQLVLNDLQHVLLDPARFGIMDKSVVLLRNGDDYDPDDQSTLYIALTVEGAHSLGNTFDRTTITADSVIANLSDLTSTRGFPIISLNLTHLEQYPFCNHAFGIQFVGSDNFYPTGRMISPAGISIITACYERRIMIDIKHMSLGARRMLIEQIRIAGDMQAILQPLVCTHAGFTGLSYKDIPNYINMRGIQGNHIVKYPGQSPVYTAHSTKRPLIPAASTFSMKTFSPYYIRGNDWSIAR
ncbi:hypothetical protein [Paraflavitalea speifideaquila]|uniref:hypothetical protein n=1 Tax=Paraflavitalea speifideaquila TaxID=3076558 RepID=UPI0028E8EAC9|nr:hypothetical protein [Paraflavitalea speifideiaquila]